MIELLGVSKRFPNETAIDYADLRFESGKSYMLLGASGCGKSTLLNMIAGILSPTSGSIRIDGKEMTSLSQKEKDAFRIAEIGYIFQDFKLLEEMTVADNLRILRLEGVDLSGAQELLARLGIADQKNKKVRQLSGGQKQRVAIARALVKQPEIILADEPTGALDTENAAHVIRLLKGISKEQSIPVAVITHNPNLVVLGDHCLTMSNGTVIDDVFQPFALEAK